MFDRYRWAWCALSGLLLIACFAPFASATCGWIALVPAWWALTRSEAVRRRPMGHGYLIGVLYFGGTFWWISNVTAIGAFFLALYLALYPAVWFWLVARLLLPRLQTAPGENVSATAPRFAAVPLALGAAAIWVALEWWRSWFLTGFNWNELGISQAHSLIFRQLAAYGGVHLISFVVVAVNVLWAEGLLAMAQTIRTKRTVRPSAPFAAALLVVAFCFALGWQRTLQSRLIPEVRTGPTFACIQPNIPQIPPGAGGSYDQFQKREADALEKTEELSETAITAADKPQLLIWPEATIDEGVFQDRPLNEAVHDICQVFPGYFLLGSQDFDLGAPAAPGEHVPPEKQRAPKLYNVAYFFTPGGDQYDEYRKTRLVMLGEYLPFATTFPWLRKLVGMGLDFSTGPGPVVFTMKSPALKIAPLICFEDTLPEVADKAAALQPDVFITITNDGWYTGIFATWGVRQHLNQAIFRCVEHDRPMIRCANTGVSCVIDPRGEVVSRFRGPSGADIDVGGIFTGRLLFHPARGTLYERWGDWIVLLSALATVMLGVRFLVRRVR